MQENFAGDDVAPSEEDRAFFPTAKTIGNIIHKTCKANGLLAKRHRTPEVFLDATDEASKKVKFSPSEAVLPPQRETLANAYPSERPLEDLPSTSSAYPYKIIRVYEDNSSVKVS